MDRNTIIGLGLIALILGVFTYINQPDPEEFKKQQELAEIQLKERQALENERNEQQETTNLDPSPSVPEHHVILLDEEGNPVINESGDPLYIDTTTNQQTSLAALPLVTEEQTIIKVADEDFIGKTISLSNNKLFVEINTKGGGVTSVFLKEHQTYDDFQKNEGTDKITPLQLFNEKHSTNQLVFTQNGQEVKTSDLPFTVVKESKDFIELRRDFGPGQSISFIYSLVPDSYHIGYEIKMKGFEGDVLPENVMLDWSTRLLKTERLLSEQRRTSTVFFKGWGDSYDYLSEFSDDELEPKLDLEWVAFKQSYFSSIMMPETYFKKEGSQLSIKNITEDTPEDELHVKDFNARVNLNMTSSGHVKIDWFFGPNDYYLLSNYGKNVEDIVNLGWGIFRWVNIYAIQPIFTWLANTGMNLGLAIFLLTLIVKFALTPIQWKMYSSSAKMRILKPEIDELNKKFPNKEDAMKKQMEMMTLYRESGASPLAGCVPMLIQMPILFAVFRFFPSTFELRQKSFLWAEDLSSFDSVYDLSFNIPFYGDHISLFTLLMAGTTLIYTVLNSSNMAQPTQPGMPNMKVIMYIFPIMMIFFFNNFASGLSYYYFLSTLISILTMLMIKKFFVNEAKLKAKMAARKESSKVKGGKSKKSKFQERLEQMQKAQQEKLKNKK